MEVQARRNASLEHFHFDLTRDSQIPGLGRRCAV
jgi:hypothetical protein